MNAWDEGALAVWTTFDLTTLPDGTVALVMRTNDDDDDGWPDPEVAVQHLTFRDLATALRVGSRGGSRTGWAGHRVTVTVDGKAISEDEARVLVERGTAATA